MWWFTLGACWFSTPSPPACKDPHLWYAPDSSGDVYFGCDRPEGWLETPPNEGAYAVVMSSNEETGTPYTDGDYTDESSTTDVSSTDEGQSGPPRQDTADLPPDTFDTGALPEEQGREEDEPIDTELIDTWDTASPEGEGPDTADTGLPFEEEPDTADTGLPLEEEGMVPETGLPPAEDTAPPMGDTGI
jgi:hypothetical protein